MKGCFRCVLIIGCLLIFISSTLFAADKYVSSRYSMEYHKATCKKAIRIDPLIKITYKTAKQALDAGKQPCRVWNPSIKDSFLEGILEISNTALILPKVNHSARFFAFTLKIDKIGCNVVKIP